MEQLYKRVVIKVGSDVLSTDNGQPKIEVFRNIVEQLLILKRRIKDIVLITSGAVPFGRAEFGRVKTKGETVAEKQKYASVGQPILMEMYRQFFKDNACHVAQILPTKNDIDSEELLAVLDEIFAEEQDTIPIFNANDTVEIDELKISDNDRLAGAVAKIIEADALVFATCVNGLLEDIDDPNSVVPVIEYGDTSKRELIVPSKSQNGTGGMGIKLDVGFEMQDQGRCVHILNGTEQSVLTRVLLYRERISTLFLPRSY